MVDSDRYLIDRRNFDVVYSHYLLQRKFETDTISYRERKKRHILSLLLHGCEIDEQKILKQTKSSEYVLNDLVKMAGRMPRKIRMKPDRILEAPNTVNDYYTFLIDWSCKDILAVALDTTVYAWHPETNKTDELLAYEKVDTSYISCLAWHSEGTYLSVTNVRPKYVDIWDFTTKRKVVDLKTNDNQVISQSWNNKLLSCGTIEGNILHFDIRASGEPVMKTRIKDVVCGLAWSHNGKYLASGSNNTVTIWDYSHLSNKQPIISNECHKAAVKAIAWCPWEPNIVASGGGLQDQTVKVWNSMSGKEKTFVQTDSQVTSILWSENYKELLTAQGKPDFSMKLWEYPKMELVEELKNHTERILQTVLSHDKTTVAAISADETLTIWNCFPHSRKNTSKRGKPDRDFRAFKLSNTIR